MIAARATTGRDLVRVPLDGRRVAALGLSLALLTAGLLTAGADTGAAAVPKLGMICTEGTGSGTPDDPKVFDLVAKAGRIDTPDGNSVYMWGYAPEGGKFQMPGPVLCVTEDQTVRVNLTNQLPDTTNNDDDVSIIFPGQSGVVATGDSVDPNATLLTAAAAHGGGTATYEFFAGEPGTYLYESGSEPSKQVQMGLYGALVVRPSMGPDYAYNDAGTRFDPSREYLILIHDIDPALHHKVELDREKFPISNMHDRYWTINGRSFPDSVADNGASWLPRQPYGALVAVEASPDLSTPPALIRYANAGMVNHPFHPHGNHLRVIAQDGRVLPTFDPSATPGVGTEVFTKTIGSGQTFDLLFRWVDVEGWNPEGNPLPAEVDPLPNLQNLVFKDDATFFSGSSYLGYQDELPVGVTSWNECGEFYFPWHSHALNEFQNFDEGFGGLATVVRVDPPGGC